MLESGTVAGEVSVSRIFTLRISIRYRNSVSLNFKAYSHLDALHGEAIKSCHLLHVAFLMKVILLFSGYIQ